MLPTFLNRLRPTQYQTLLRQRRRNLLLEMFEDRTVPATIDVTGPTAGAFSTDGNVFMQHVTINVSTGSGTFNPFLRTQHKDSEQGYNTDFRGSPPSQYLLDAKTDPKTKAIMLGNVREVMLDASGNIVTTGGTLYREFLLDLGEPGNATSESGKVNFSGLEFFTSTSSTEHITGNTWVSGILGGATPRYNLDAVGGGDDFTLRDLTSGNGRLDYAMCKPTKPYHSPTAAFNF